MTDIAPHRVADRDSWLEERKALLAEEKEMTRLRDRIAARRRELPWVKVDKSYRFDTPQGQKTLADLFDGRSQLIIQHFMFAPDWDQGCVGCSFGLDHIEAALQHIEHHDVSFVAVARAPLAQLEAFWKRMGWRARFASSAGSDFNYDFRVSFTPDEVKAGKAHYNFRETEIGISEMPGISVFCKDSRCDIFHTYSTYDRGSEGILTAYALLDLTPKGRNENGPRFDLSDWVKHHDLYDKKDSVPNKSDCCHAS